MQHRQTLRIAHQDERRTQTDRRLQTDVVEVIAEEVERPESTSMVLGRLAVVGRIEGGVSGAPGQVGGPRRIEARAAEAGVTCSLGDVSIVGGTAVEGTCDRRVQPHPAAGGQRCVAHRPEDVVGEGKAPWTCSGTDQPSRLRSFKRVEDLVDGTIDRRGDERHVDLLTGDGRHVEHLEISGREPAESGRDDLAKRSTAFAIPCQLAKEQRIPTGLPHGELRIEITTDGVV